MSAALPSSQRWLRIRSQFLLDALIMPVSAWVGTAVRFGDLWPKQVVWYWPTLLVAAVSLPALIYIFGLYSVHGVHLRKRERLSLLIAAFACTILIELALGSVSFSSRIGRGVLAVQVPVGLMLLLAHHAALVRRSLVGWRRRVAMVIANERDEQALRIAEKLKPSLISTAGYFREEALAGHTGAEYLGRIENLGRVMEARRIDALVCGREHLRSPEFADELREVCFSGIPVLSMTDLVEEAYEAVPLGLVDMEWLVTASSMPRLRYAKKVKRVFDVVAALGVGLALAPFFVLGCLLVWVSSDGPIFYRQERCGRFGRRINVWKLRTMTVDAEKAGAQWAAGRRDPRLTPVGGLLRTFRIDEIPQLWNILIGEMSFVGPRPERPAFVEQLAKEIPYFQERLLVQPGLTGWAQVCYPYGASVEDARRKLEYDLYYVKHMSLLLDLFILLDTIRTVLRGGARRRTTVALVEIERLMAEPLTLEGQMV